MKTIINLFPSLHPHHFLLFLHYFHYFHICQASPNQSSSFIFSANHPSANTIFSYYFKILFNVQFSSVKVYHVLHSSRLHFILSFFSSVVSPCFSSLLFSPFLLSSILFYSPLLSSIPLPSIVLSSLFFSFQIFYSILISSLLFYFLLFYSIVFNSSQFLILTPLLWILDPQY